MKTERKSETRLVIEVYAVNVKRRNPIPIIAHCCTWFQYG